MNLRSTSAPSEKPISLLTTWNCASRVLIWVDWTVRICVCRIELFWFSSVFKFFWTHGGMVFENPCAWSAASKTWIVRLATAAWPWDNSAVLHYILLSQEYKLKMSCSHHTVACRDSTVTGLKCLGSLLITDLSSSWAPAVKDDMEILLMHLLSPIIFKISDNDPDCFSCHDNRFVSLFFAELEVMPIVSLWTWAQEWPLIFVLWYFICGRGESSFCYRQI